MWLTRVPTEFYKSWPGVAVPNSRKTNKGFIESFRDFYTGIMTAIFGHYQSGVGIGIYLSGSGWDLNDHMAILRGMLSFTRSKAARSEHWNRREKETRKHYGMGWYEADMTDEVCPLSFMNRQCGKNQKKGQRDVVTAQLRKFQKRLYCMECDAIPWGVNTRPYPTSYVGRGVVVWRLRSWRASKGEDVSSKFGFKARPLPNWPDHQDMQ